MMPTDDPWQWTVDDLVSQLCYSGDLFDAAGYGQPNCPDPLTFENQLRSQQIAGAAFLTSIDANVLRDDLHISALGQRSALMAVIGLLRSRSLTYKHHTATTGVEALNISNQNAMPLQLSAGPSETLVTDVNGRKRRKITLSTSVSMPARPRVDDNLGPLPTARTSEDHASAGEWEYLRHWDHNEYMEEEDVNEKGDDDEGTSLVEVVDEDEPDAVEPMQTRTGKLSPAEVEAIINDCINSYEDQWQPGKGEERVPDPTTLWEQAENAGQREQLYQANKANIAFFEYRRNALSEEIYQIPWNSADDVRRACRNLETTVDLWKQAEWLTSIYELPPANEDSEQEDGPIEQDRHPATPLNPTGPIEIIDLSSGSETGEGADEAPDEIIVDAEEFPRVVDTYNDQPTLQGPQTPKSLSADNKQDNTDLRPPLISQSSCKRLQVLGDNPGIASVKTVSRWKWEDLVDKLDRKRIVMKVMQEMIAEDRENIRDRIKSVKKQDFMTEITNCISMLLRKEQKMQGVLPRDLPKILTITKLFLSWWLADNYFRTEPTEWRLEELAECLEANRSDLEIYYAWVTFILEHTFSKEALSRPSVPLEAEVIVISDDD